MRHAIESTLILALAVAAMPAAAQSVPTVTVGEPDATFADPLSVIRGLRELSDGRVIVTDMIEQSVRVLDFGTGQSQDVGRRGDGPREYGAAGELFALSHDTTWMLDMGRLRFVVLLPDGSIADSTISLSTEGGLPIFPHSVDQRGRIYYDISSIVLGGIMPPGMEPYATSGHAPLLRLDLRAKQTDTLALVGFPPLQISGGKAARSGPYRSRDLWAITPEGRVAVARYRDYHVEWLVAGKAPVAGPPVPYEPVKIGTAEKEAWADRQMRGRMVITRNGRTRIMPLPRRPDIDAQQWPDAMPPFASVAMTPQGEFWVELSRPASQERRTYDVFDTQGRRMRQVTLPAGRTLVGFGDGTLYAVRTDADDLQWLERYSGWDTGRGVR